MREFSTNEKRIIKSALISGSGLSGMLSDGFRLGSQLLITYKTTGVKRFVFASGAIGKDAAFMELIDEINLLQYLLDNGLVTAYPIAATVIRNYETEDETISLGEGDGLINLNWNTSKEDDYIADFVKRHENTFFKATEPLVSLTKHNWQTWDQRKHQQGIIVAISIAIVTSIITAAGIWIQYYKSYNDLQDRIDSYDIDLQRTKENQIHDQENSIIKIEALNKKIDSLQVSRKAQVKKNFK